MQQTNSESDAVRGDPAKLDSWKQIAVYLGREVRTVQRWEKSSGLPVRRLQHEKRGSVYAYTGELDAWIAARDPQQTEGASPDTRTPRRSRVAYLLAAATLAGVAGIAAALFARPLTHAMGGSSEGVAAAALVSTPARNVYLRGLYYMNRGTREDLEQSIRHFREALSEDPQYASAYAGIAKAYVYLGTSGKEGSARTLLARDAAERAVRLDDSLADAHEALGLVRALGDWDWRGGEVEFQRALRLNPNLASAHSSYALFEALLGRQDIAIAEARHAVELEPLSAILGANLAWYYYWARQYDEAIGVSRDVLRSEPQFMSAQRCIIRSLVAQRRFEDARTELRAQLQEAGMDPAARGLNAPSAEQAVHDYFAQWLARLDQLQSKEDGDSFDMAIALAALDRKEELLACLERAFQRHEIIAVVMNVEPLFDAYRTEPRFAEILRRVGLPQPEPFAARAKAASGAPPASGSAPPS